MNKVFRVAMITTCLVVLAGCGPGNVDASSKKSVEKSLSKLVEAAPKDMRPKLEIAQEAYHKAYLEGEQASENLPSWNSVNGMSVTEFLHYSEQFLEHKQSEQVDPGPLMYVTTAYLRALKTEQAQLRARRTAVTEAGFYTHDQFQLTGVQFKPVDARTSTQAGAVVLVTVVNNAPYNVFGPILQVNVTIKDGIGSVVDRKYKTSRKIVIEPFAAHTYSLECCTFKDNPLAYEVARLQPEGLNTKVVLEQISDNTRTYALDKELFLPKDLDRLNAVTACIESIEVAPEEWDPKSASPACSGGEAADPRVAVAEGAPVIDGAPEPGAKTESAPSGQTAEEPEEQESPPPQ